MKRPLPVLAFIVFLISVACGTSGAPSCESVCDGCCSASGVCNPGTEKAACGQAGLACLACASNEACVFGSCVPTGSGTGGGAASGAGGGSGTPSASGPTITALSASGTLTNNGYVTLSATVSDPDGVGDLSGGTLNLLDGTSLGPFTGAVGSYTFTLTWGGSLPASAINFASAAGSLQLEAKFYDRASNVSTRRLTLSLQCNSGTAACSGECVTVATDDMHCGRCNNPVAEGATCVGGAPSCGGSYCSGKCVRLDSDNNNCGTCGNDCVSWAASRGFTSEGYCSAGRCAATVFSTARVSCASACSAKSATCTDTTRCSTSYSPYVTSAQYGGCASYYNVSRCGEEVPVKCATVPVASTTSGTATCAFGSVDCVCQK